MMNKPDPVVEELQKARIKLLLDWPIFGPLILNLELKEVDWCPTAATDGRFFYYNREFCKKLDRAQLLFLTAHEVLHCFPAGTILPGAFKAIEDFKNGDHVIGNGGNHSNVVVPMSRHYEGEIVTIKPRGLLPIKVTPEHPILIRRFHWKSVVDDNGRRRNVREWSEPEWKTAGTVGTDDWVHVPRVKGNTSNFIMEFEYKNGWSVPDLIRQGVILDQEIATFLGWYVAEGSTTRYIGSGRNTLDSKEQSYNFTSAFSLNINELPIAEYLQEILKRRFGVSGWIELKPENKSCCLKFSSNPLGKWLIEECGSDAHCKRMPNSVLYNKDLSILSSFIRSYIDGDGHVSRMVNYGTVSKILALQMQLAGARFGILFNLFERHPGTSVIRGKQIQYGTLYHGYTGWKEAFELIGKLSSATRSTRFTGLVDDAVMTPIRSVTKEHFVGEVHNIETTCHTYTAGNIVTHNCVYDHIYRRGRRNKDLWNMAVDYIVNYTLITTKDQHDQTIGRKIENVPPVDKILYDPAYTDEFSSEELYALLEKNQVKIQMPLDMHLEPDPSEAGEEKKDGDSSGGETDGPPKYTEDQIQQIRDIIRTTLVQAAQQPNLDPGKLPLGIQRMLNRLLEPKIDWRQMLDNVLRSSIKYDYTYMKMSRRFWTTGFILPGQDVQDKVCAMAFLDGSGSTTQEMVTDFLSECKGIMETFPDFELTIATFDTEVYGEKLFTPDNADEIENYEFIGGGGTAPSCCWNYMKEHEIMPHKCLLFTDGYVGDDWGDPDYCDTLFIIHSNPKAKASHGLTAHYEPRSSS